MKTKSWVLIVLLLATSGVMACGGEDDPVAPQTLPIDALAKREGVLTQIEYAYNKRRITTYDKVLDANFTFYLAPGDVVGSMPDSWSRVDELDLNTKLFDKNYATLPCQSIYMDIKVEDGLTWVEIIPSSAPTETWYQTTVFYNFRFDISPNTFIPNTGSKATFTVRNAGTDEKPHWQLVEMSDLGGSPFMNATAAAATEPTTWGGVKLMYH